jgi:hypothetical protein
MRPIRLAAAAMAAATVIATMLVAAPAGGATGSSDAACGLLSDQRAMASISGAGEIALKIRCGLVPQPSAVRPSAPSAPSAPTIGADVLVNNRNTDTWAHITQSEATVAALSGVMLAGWNDSGQFLSTGDLSGYGRSIDGGLTWTDMGVPTTPLGVVTQVFGDPVLASDRNRDPGDAGVFYYANLGVVASGTSIIAVHKTTDGGLTWDQAANASPGASSADFQDKEWMAVDTRASGTGAGNIYVCWTRFFSGGQQIRLSRSTDGGATFTVIQTDLSAESDVSGCQVAVDPNNGNVYVSWTNRNFGASPRTIKFRRSTDRGTTFDPEKLIGTAAIAETITSCGGVSRSAFVDSEANGTSRAIRSTSFSDIAVNPANSEVYVVFHAAGLAGGALADIGFVQSSDFGVTFSAQTRVNTGTTGQQFMPSIAVNKAGKARAVFYSTQRSATNRLLDVYMTQSVDGGTTWTASKRVTDVSFDRPTTNPNFDTGGGLTLASCYMGDYNTVEAAPKGLGTGALNIVWGDNRLDGNAGMGGVQPDPDIRFDK